MANQCTYESMFESTIEIMKDYKSSPHPRLQASGEFLQAHPEFKESTDFPLSPMFGLFDKQRTVFVCDYAELQKIKSRKDSPSDNLRARVFWDKFKDESIHRQNIQQLQINIDESADFGMFLDHSTNSVMSFIVSQFRKLSDVHISIRMPHSKATVEVWLEHVLPKVYSLMRKELEWNSNFTVPDFEVTWNGTPLPIKYRN